MPVILEISFVGCKFYGAWLVSLELDKVQKIKALDQPFDSGQHL